MATNAHANASGRSFVQFANLAANLNFLDNDATITSVGTADFATTATIAAGTAKVFPGDWIVYRAGHDYDSPAYQVESITDASNLEIKVSIGSADADGVNTANAAGTTDNWVSNEFLIGSTFIANGVRYRVKAVDSNSNQIELTSPLQAAITNGTVVTFQYNSTNIKSIRFGTTAAGAIYYTSSTAEITSTIDTTYSDTIIQEPDKKRLIFPISDTFVESIRNTSHRYMKTEDLTTNGSGVATPTLNTSNGTEFIVQDLSEVIAVLASNGNHIDATAITSANITFGETSTAIRVSFPVQRTAIPSGSFDGDLSIPNDFIFGNTVTIPMLFDASASQKYIDSSEGQVLLPADTFADGAIDSNGKPNFKRLGLTGVIRIQKIYEVPIAHNTGNPTNVDIAADGNFVDRSADFDVDYGQNDMVVDHVKIKLRDGTALPVATKKILIILDRVKTTSTSDGSNLFYTANSYPDIYYNLLDSVYASDKSIDRLESIDFRPRVVEVPDMTGLSEATNPLDTSLVGEDDLEFTDITTIPHAANSNLLTGQISNYLSRKDKLIVTSDYGLEIVQGAPDRKANSPESDMRSLLLYDIALGPYILGKIDIQTIAHDHSLYKMQDIARINKRLSEVEKTIQLDMIEKNILAAEVNDKNNTNLFKTGVLVDSFKNFDVADVTDPNFNAALDTMTGQLRPAADTYCFSLEYNATLADSTAQISEDDVLLAPRHITGAVVAIKNVVASRIENLNPFAVATFEGTLRLFAAKDYWKTKEVKDVTTDVAGDQAAYARMQQNIPDRVVWGDVKGVNWSGVKVDHTSSAQKITNRKIHDAKAFNIMTFGIGFLLGGFANPHSYMKAKVDIKERGAGTQTGIKTTVEWENTKKLSGTNVVSQSVIKYMRNPPHAPAYTTSYDAWAGSKTQPTRSGIFFNADGMRASTTLYPFFDDVNIMTYVRPAIILKVTNTSANRVLYDSLIAGQGKGGGGFVGAAGRGTVILGAADVTTTQTQRCIIVNKSKDTSFLYYHVVPPTRGSLLYDKRKALLTTVTIAGTTVTLADVIRAKQGGVLRIKTDPTGSVGGVFVVPLTTFATGTRMFKLTDTSSGDVATAKTFAEQNFEASGMNVKMENQYISTRVPVIKRTTVGRPATIYRDV